MHTSNNGVAGGQALRTFRLVSITGAVASFLALLPRAIVQPDHFWVAALFWAVVYGLVCGLGWAGGVLGLRWLRRVRARAAEARVRLGRTAQAAVIIARAETDEQYRRRLHRVAEQVGRAAAPAPTASDGGPMTAEREAEIMAMIAKHQGRAR